MAVVNGKPLPAPDEIPEEEPHRPNNLSTEWNPRTSNQNINSLTIPMGGRTLSQASDRSANLTASHPAFSLPSPTSPIANSPSSTTFFRGRAKTLAALTTGSRNTSQTEMTPQEVQLPKDPYVNGQRLEVFLYKDASECPICFLYYPPYLNKTRCCDQSICSECFVQIKRPDPHPPEHHGDSNDAGSPPQEPQEDGMLVSEPACCPFCVQPEFGITYEPPPFRRGLVYANSSQLGKVASAMSSTTSLNSQGPATPARRRAGSLAATDTSVITTDRVRPDWAKKLADARAHALRRAAAATALHNAAYMMGNIQSDSRGFSLGRRRRTMFGGDSASSSGNGTPRGEANALPAASAPGSSNRNDGQNELTSNRQSSRRGNRLEDLEDLMMMEAIRLSLAAEEERKKKEEKEAAKEARKEEKKKAKEAKKADKAARKSGFFASSSQDDLANSPSTSTAKGKAVDRSGGYTGFNPMNEPTSTLNASSSSSRDDPQKHLEQSRSTLNTSLQREISSTGTALSVDGLSSSEQTSHRSALRNLSNSSTSSLAESFQESLQNDSQGNFGASTSSFGPSPNASGVSLGGADDSAAQGTPGTEPMFNFRSLAEVITKDEDKSSDRAQHIEHAVEGNNNTSDCNIRAPVPINGDRAAAIPPKIAIEPPQAPLLPEMEPLSPLEASIATLKPGEGDRSPDGTDRNDEIESAPRVEAVKHGSTELDHKHIGNVSMVDRIEQHQPTQ